MSEKLGQGTPSSQKIKSSAEARQELATKLREAREGAGYTIQDLAYTTKIMIDFISAIEAANFASLPGEVFVRGFVKSLCKELQLDTFECLELLTVAYDEDRQVEMLVVTGSPGAGTVRVGSDGPSFIENLRYRFKSVPKLSLKSKTSRRVLQAAVAILAVVLAAQLIYQLRPFTRSHQQKSAAKATQLKKRQVAVAPAPESTTAVNSNAAEVAEIGKEGVNAEGTRIVADATAVNSDGLQKLQLVVKEPVNIRINIDGKGWETARYEPKTYNIDFKVDVNLLIFDAMAVDINFNGRSVGSLGSKGRVRRISFVAQAPEVKSEGQSTRGM